MNQSEAVTVPAAHLYLKARRVKNAQALGNHLGREFVERRRAYGKLVEGMTAISARRPIEAVQVLRDALKLADLWLVRYWLGVAYVEAGAYAEALSELEACKRRRGEASAVFLDDVPSWRYTAPVGYWLARAQDGVGLRAQALQNYKAFLTLRSASAKDPVVIDARKRAGLSRELPPLTPTYAAAAIRCKPSYGCRGADALWAGTLMASINSFPPNVRTIVTTTRTITPLGSNASDGYLTNRTARSPGPSTRLRGEGLAGFPP